MKIRVYSDVHNEFVPGREWVPARLETDPETVLVLAGDVANGKKLADYVDSLADRFLAVVYILGNHELYKRNIDKKEGFVASAKNAHFLDNDVVEINGVEFVGTTLWTDMNRKDPLSCWEAKGIMNDFRYIKQGDSYTRFTPGRWLLENDKARVFLKSAVNPDRKQVVVTHHPPDYACAGGNPNAGNRFDAYYYNRDLQDLIADAGFWVFGHTHHRFTGYLGDTYVYSNPRGYPTIPLVDGFQETEVIDLDQL